MGEGLKATTAQFVVSVGSDTGRNTKATLIGDRVELILSDGTCIEVVASPSHQGSLVIRAVGTRSRIVVMPELANEIRVLASVSFPDITNPDREYIERMKKTQSKSIKSSEKIPNLHLRRAPKNRFKSIKAVKINMKEFMKP